MATLFPLAALLLEEEEEESLQSKLSLSGGNATFHEMDNRSW